MVFFNKIQQNGLKCPKNGQKTNVCHQRCSGSIQKPDKIGFVRPESAQKTNKISPIPSEHA